MTKILGVLAIALLVTFGLVAVSQAASEGNGGRRFTIEMTGAQEPAGGDTDGSGLATFRLNPGQERLCYTLEVADIAPATAAHIHEAPVGVAGPVIIPLSAPTDGDSSACIDVDRDELLEIIQHPEDYYVNVHNASYPAGAVRGQFER
jgi:hypothetical protein